LKLKASDPLPDAARRLLQESTVAEHLELLANLFFDVPVAGVELRRSGSSMGFNPKNLGFTADDVGYPVGALQASARDFPAGGRKTKGRRVSAAGEGVGGISAPPGNCSGACAVLVGMRRRWKRRCTTDRVRLRGQNRT